jgi:hypothetical protein
VGLLIVPGSQTVVVGQVFSIVVQVQAGATAIDSAATYLNFDATKLQVVDASGAAAAQVQPCGPLTIALQNEVRGSVGQIDYAAGLLQGSSPSETFCLAQVHFRAIAAAPSVQIAFNTVPPRNSDAAAGGRSVLGWRVNGGVTIAQ